MSFETPRTPIYKDFFLLQLAALIFLVDQFSKFLVRDQLLFRQSFPVSGFVRFTHTHNTGSAFGIFQDQNTPLILVSIIGVGILAMIYRSQRTPTALLRLSIGLQIGGALGNLLDRVRLGHVTDFMDVGPWPVFNVADASIVTGLVILAWIFLVLEPNASKDIDSIGTTGGYDWCPVCDGEMRTVVGGWRCFTCGVKEQTLDQTV
ncbi:MAG: signal peptidase II [SAR202 cluster bacterium]|nr:signal peptidase II [SAR202 cluster bacterium]